MAESSSAPSRPTALALPFSLAPGLRPRAGGGELHWVLPTSSTTASPGRRGGSGAPGASGPSSPGILGLGKERGSRGWPGKGRPHVRLAVPCVRPVSVGLFECPSLGAFLGLSLSGPALPTLSRRTPFLAATQPLSLIPFLRSSRRTVLVYLATKRLAVSTAQRVLLTLLPETGYCPHPSLSPLQYFPTTSPFTQLLEPTPAIATTPLPSSLHLQNISLIQGLCATAPGLRQ